ncbi:hypothetical protein [Streptomyces sp. CAU 1734]|uniref:hypothetical protein n=1 Tax=Streptomyces sp. CAU 1734 TaxID=3140360 RepID=UPI0032618208
MGTGCGCGCGGAPQGPSVFVRPRFFAGQLLTEDDLTLLADYTTAKSRLHNRSLYGPGVVCGLGVVCDPCGGGTVLVHPGHAFDGAGHDIVVACPERVDVLALVREHRVAALGAECPDTCAQDGPRRWGLFARYEEFPADPVAPYATEEPCPSPGCVPSRIREGFRFVIGDDAAGDHAHRPGTRLLAALGDRDAFGRARARAERIAHWTEPLLVVSLAPGRTFRFDPADAERFTTGLARLREITAGGAPPTPSSARELAELVRAVSASIARFDTHDRAGQDRLTGLHPGLAGVPEARTALGTACDLLAAADAEAAWPDPLRRSVARAVVTETRARIVPAQGDPDAPLEVRLLAQGTPLGPELNAEFRADLALIREWLLGRLDRNAGTGDCRLRADAAGADVPPPRPAGPEPLTTAAARRLAEAAAVLTAALRRHLTDAACAALQPPCGPGTATDVLLASVEVDGCDVVRVRTAGREQVLPGGAAYGAWLPVLHRLRELAGRLSRAPLPHPADPPIPAEGPVPRPYAEGLLIPPPAGRAGELEEMINLLLGTVPAEPADTPCEPPPAPPELALLGARVSELAAIVAELRAAPRPEQAGTPPGEPPGRVRERAPKRLGPRLAEPAAESPPPAAPRRPRSPRTPKRGETT